MYRNDIAFKVPTRFDNKKMCFHADSFRWQLKNYKIGAYIRFNLTDTNVFIIWNTYKQRRCATNIFLFIFERIIATLATTKYLTHTNKYSSTQNKMLASAMKYRQNYMFLTAFLLHVLDTKCPPSGHRGLGALGGHFLNLHTKSIIEFDAAITCCINIYHTHHVP